MEHRNVMGRGSKPYAKEGRGSNFCHDCHFLAPFFVLKGSPARQGKDLGMAYKMPKMSPVARDKEIRETGEETTMETETLEAETKALSPAVREALKAYKPVFFNGKLTMRNVETGEHRTFRISTQKEDASFAPGQRIVSLLTGADNEADYTGFGFVDDASGIRIWTRKREQGSPFPGYGMMLEAYFRGQSGNGHIVREGDNIKASLRSGEARFYSVHLEKRCSRCNRTLTVPESTDAGIGPICMARML